MSIFGHFASFAFHCSCFVCLQSCDVRNVSFVPSRLVRGPRGLGALYRAGLLSNPLMMSVNQQPTTSSLKEDWRSGGLISPCVTTYQSVNHDGCGSRAQLISASSSCDEGPEAPANDRQLIMLLRDCLLPAAVLASPELNHSHPPPPPAVYFYTHRQQTSL